MIRHLAYLAPLAVLGLAACNGPAQLTKAKEGECFTVVGREPGGAPKLEKTECLTSAQTEVAPQTQVAAAEGAASPAVCPTTPAICPPAATARAERHAARSERTFFGRRSRETARSRTTERAVTVRQGEYTRVYTPDYPQPELLGPPPSSYREDSYRYSYRSQPEPYIPPPPPRDRYDRRHGEREYGYHEERGRREGYGHREYHAAPIPAPPVPAPYIAPPAPPPPPPQAYGHGQGSRSYSQGSGSASGSYSRQESYSESESQSSSSSSSSSRYGYGYGQGQQAGPPRGAPVMAPMNGPHFPVDSNGYLTWRGKTPAAPPPGTY